jgi:hypothetical protein
MRGSGLRTPALELSITASNWAKISAMAWAFSAEPAMPVPCPVTTLLVMQPTLNRALQAFSAATMRGRTSPDSRGSTSAPRSGVAQRVDSSRNMPSKAAASISLRSNSAQALVSGSAALTRRMKSFGQAALGLEPAEGLERRGGEHPAEVPDHRLDRHARLKHLFDST